MWTLQQGIEFCQKIEPVLNWAGAHCSLGGSVLTKGKSEKDLDVFIYSHKTTNAPTIEFLQQVLTTRFKIEGWKKAEHATYGDDKKVFWTTYQNKRIDFFFVA